MSFFAVSGHFWGVGRVFGRCLCGAGRGRGSGGSGGPFFVVLGGFFVDFCRFLPISDPKERTQETASNQKQPKTREKASKNSEKASKKSQSQSQSQSQSKRQHKSKRKRQRQHPHHSRVAHPRSRVSSVQVAEPNAGGLEGDTCAARVWSSFIPPVFWARTCIVAAKGIP